MMREQMVYDQKFSTLINLMMAVPTVYVLKFEMTSSDIQAYRGHQVSFVVEMGVFELNKLHKSIFQCIYSI